MRIGTVEIPARVHLAPLAAYTSWPFRRICRRMGAGLVVTEVVKARELARGIPATFQIIEYKRDEHPISGQIMAADPDEAGEAAAIMGGMGYDLVDLNCGCPKRRVLSDDMGGALMEFPEQAEKILAAMVRKAMVPVTVKIRAGRWKGKVTAIEMARRAEGAGAVAICVHPRFSEGAATAPPDWSVIAQVKQAVEIPVIGNGGIHSPADAVKMMKETGCDAVAIGQAAVGRPWIFRQTSALIETGRDLPPPAHEEILDILLEHYHGLVEHHGEKRGTIMMRKQSCHYAKHLRNGKLFNAAIIRASSTAEYMAAVEEHLRPASATNPP